MNWSEKYRPKIFDDIYINQDNKNIILKWMNDFKNKKKKFSNCLIIHGPPGIGKTSLANIILTINNYDVIEFNSSDIRNQKILKDKLQQINGNVNIINFMCNQKKQIGIIIDELDGINSTEKGALKELTSIINNTKKFSSPFICTTNSLNKKIELLKKKSIYIKLNKPNKLVIKKFINKICLNENIKISEHIKTLICDNSQLDFRRIIILMEYLFRYNSSPTENILINLISNYDKKKISYTCYESTDKILNKYSSDFNNILDNDKSTVGYLIYENFLNYIIHNKKSSNNVKLEIITQIYNNFLLSDILDNKIYINQYFYLNFYNDFIKFNIVSYLINSLDKSSYNKYNKLNYSTMINKISYEYLNIKTVNIILSKHIYKSHIYTADYIYSLLNSDKKKAFQVIEHYNIDNQILEKICKMSTFYSKDDNLKQLIHF